MSYTDVVTHQVNQNVIRTHVMHTIESVSHICIFVYVSMWFNVCAVYLCVSVDLGTVHRSHMLSTCTSHHKSLNAQAKKRMLSVSFHFGMMILIEIKAIPISVSHISNAQNQ